MNQAVRNSEELNKSHFNVELLLRDVEKEFIRKDIIKKRKSEYGNNFTRIAQLWKNRLQVEELSDDFVCELMSDMKRARIENILDMMSQYYPGVKEYNQLAEKLKDNYVDYANYKWICLNYKEYLEL